MKKGILNLFRALLGFSFALLMSCGNETEKRLAGEWTMAAMHNPKFDTAKMMMELRLKIINDSLDQSKTKDSLQLKSWKHQAIFLQDEIDSIPARMKAGMDSTFLKFYPKGTFVSVAFDSRDSGSWEVNEKTNKLITTNSAGRTDSMILFSVTGDSMRVGKDTSSWMIFKKNKR